MWMLRSAPKTSARAASIPNHWAITPGQRLYFYFLIMCACAHGSRAFGGQKRVLGALEPPDVSARTGNRVFCKSSTHWCHVFGLKICFLNVFNVYFYFIYLGACTCHGTCGGQNTICGDQFSPSTRVPGTKPGSSGLAAVTFPHLAHLASPMTCFVTPTPLQHCSLAGRSAASSPPASSESRRLPECTG